MDAKEFAQQFLLAEVKKMQTADVRLHLLAAISHNIEACGALLDVLPFKAKGQGKKRFNLALRKLFPPTYINANQQLDLYGQLRSHLSHSMLPAKSIQVFQNNEDKHLTFNQKVLNISLNTLYNDYCCAINKLIKKLDSGKLKNKRIQFENLETLLE